jgi:hypothetical protein
VLSSSGVERRRPDDGAAASQRWLAALICRCRERIVHLPVRGVALHLAAGRAAALRFLGNPASIIRSLFGNSNFVKIVENLARNGSGTAGERSGAVRQLKRDLVLKAAREVFEAKGLDGPSLHAIAARAGYTPATLYFHFDSMEAIYGAVLQDSLANLSARVEMAVARTQKAIDRLHAAAIAFFRFFAANHRDLDLGFYLFRGGMKPNGLGRRGTSNSMRRLLGPGGSS